MKDLAALLKYAEQFRSLHTSFTQANNRAPHKFILLYSLCLLYESGSLHTEKIDFSDTLWKNGRQYSDSNGSGGWQTHTTKKISACRSTT
ncbi:hypothetical protein [Neisseria flavescens]|uniref:hypothetical protein n=1 Tax=Neisseria flavescens TaxID=484 RepID=UPI000ABFAAF8|nr:hypothetical protein [Neisseria flavescens]